MILFIRNNLKNKQERFKKREIIYFFNKTKEYQMKEQPIGFLDSGLGGLSVVKEVKKLLPREDIEYFADNLRQPYGEKNQDELIDYTLQIISFLIKKKIKICVIAL